MTVIFQSQRQERPDSFAAEQCWESHGGLLAARSMWHWHLRRWVRGQAWPLFLFNQFSVLRPTFTIEVATPKNQPVLIQVDCERSLSLQYMYVCCQAVTSSGRCKPNCNAHVVLRDWQSNLFSHFHMRMCEKNKLIYILMSVKKKSTLSYLCIKSYWKLELHNHIETRKTPAKICVETGLSILINQILNYNFSELNFKLCGQIWYTNTYSCAVSRSWTSHLNKCSNSLQKSAFNAEITHRRNSNELPFSTSAIHREVNIQLNAKEL